MKENKKAKANGELNENSLNSVSGGDGMLIAPKNSANSLISPAPNGQASKSPEAQNGKPPICNMPNPFAKK